MKRLARKLLCWVVHVRGQISRRLLDSLPSAQPIGKQSVTIERLDPSHFTLTWRCALGLYLAKRWAQDALKGRVAWRRGELRPWGREMTGQFVHKLVLWGAERAPRDFRPYPIQSQNNRLSDAEVRAMENWQRWAEDAPLFSIVVPVHDARPEWIERLVASVKRQIYRRWELILVDDGSTDPRTRAALERAVARDGRLSLERLEENRGVVFASNRGVELANGAFLAFLDHDDELLPDALWYVARHLEGDPTSDVVYTDEELVGADGLAYPAHKPGYSPELLTAYNYCCHLLVVRRELVERVGGFRTGTDGAQDYDLILRLVAANARFGHVPRVLYRWHIAAASLSRKIDPRSGRVEQNRDLDQVTAGVVQAHLDRMGVPARAQVVDHWVRPRFLPLDQGKVSIILCTRDRPWLVYRAIRSIERLTEYPNYEIVIVDNGGQRRATRLCLAWLGRRHRVVRIENGPEGFNWARLNNEAARLVDGKYLLFLNDDVVVRSGQWLSALVGYHRFPGVGATGARLLFPNRTVQHAGLVVGTMGWGPWHALRGVPADSNHHAGYMTFPHDCLAVTGACLLTTRERFWLQGGFDERRFGVSFNDVDFCLRLHEAGQRSVYVPQAELIHYEGQTRAKAIRPAEAAALSARWNGIVDPYWSPNYSRESSHFALRARRTARRLTSGGPPRVLVIGPPARPGDPGPDWGTLFDELGRRGLCEFVGWTIPPRTWATGASRARFEESLRHRHTRGDFDVIVAQGLAMAPIIEYADRIEAVSIWHLPGILLPPKGAAPHDLAEYASALKLLDRPYQVVFSDPHSLAWAAGGQPRGNFSVLEHVPLRDSAPVAAGRARARNWLEEHWGIGKDHIVFVSVARPDRDSGWETMLAAFRRLGTRRRDRSALVLVGLGGADYHYARRLRRWASRLGESVVIVMDPESLEPYLAGGDVLVTQVADDARPASALEAMARGMAVLGTELLERSELLHPLANGYVWGRGRAGELARWMRRLMDRPETVRDLGMNSRHWLASRSTAAYVLEGWGELLVEGAELARTRRPASAEARDSAPTEWRVVDRRPIVRKELSRPARA